MRKCWPTTVYGPQESEVGIFKLIRTSLPPKPPEMIAVLDAIGHS
jgi:hypothetical protein